MKKLTKKSTNFNKRNVERGNRIKQAIRDSGKKYKEISAFVGCNTSEISRWAAGLVAPREETLVKLSMYLGRSVDELLSGSGAKRSTVEQPVDVLQEPLGQLRTILLSNNVYLKEKVLGVIYSAYLSIKTEEQGGQDRAHH